MKSSFRIFWALALLLGGLQAFPQQTSTDTTWKVKARERGIINIPQHPKTLTVAKDGSGDYATIQEAVNAVRDFSQERVTINVKPGTYHEKLVVPSWKAKISLIGQPGAVTVITNSDYSGKDFPGGKDAQGRPKYSTYTSHTMIVQGDDFIAENLTIENASGRVGQAVALHVEGDRAAFKNCRLIGNQDTLYTARQESRQYYENCYIEGTTDFIFGSSTCLFDNCTIKSLVNSYVTAASTTPEQAFGYVFLNCKLIADTSATKCYLGRPWRPYSRVVFIKSEYKNTGQGADYSRRVNWSKQLSDAEVKNYTHKKIFGDWEPGK
jgi:pectinesterase